MSNDWIERTRDLVLSSKFSDPNVTATNAMPIVYFGSGAQINITGDGCATSSGMVMIGDGSPELLTLPEGASVISYHYICAGPDCDKKADLDECLDHWITVARIIELTKHFCSLMCLANWLAGELAKEEGK